MPAQENHVNTPAQASEDVHLIDRHRMSYKFPRQEDFTITRNLKRDKPQGCGYVAPTTVSNSPAGDFDGLPVEMIHNILRDLDFDTLGSMRLVNSKMKIIVDSLPEHKSMTTHAPRVIQALRETTTSAHFRAEELYTLLVSERCVTCDDFGPYLFIPLGVRCCYFCLYNNHRFAVMTVAKAETELGIKQTEFRDIFPVIRTVPGFYDWDTRRPLHPRRGLTPRYCEQMVIVSTEQANQLTGNTSPNILSTKREPRHTPRSQVQVYSGTFMGDPPYRGMAAITFPWLNQRRQILEEGLFCQGCKIGYRLNDPIFKSPTRNFRSRILAARRIAETTYTEDEFHAHFMECAMLNDLLVATAGRNQTSQTVKTYAASLEFLEHNTAAYQPAILHI